MNKPETPGSDFAVRLMSIILWILIIMSVTTICLMIGFSIIALVFLTLDINYDWSWMLAIGKT